MKFLLATTNKAKIKYYGTKLREQGVDIITLQDLEIDCDVDESGKNPIENAMIKAKAYYELSKIPTIALDEGLFLENVPNDVQPGTHVRRVGGKRLGDEEMIPYYIQLVNQYGKDGKLNGYFLKGVAIVDGDDTYTFHYKASRTFTNQRSKVIDDGYPLESIQFITTRNKFKSELSEIEKIEFMNEEQEELSKFILDTVLTIEEKKKKLVR